MANCPKCNAVMDDNAKFCTACGEKVEAPKADAAQTVEEPKTQEAPKAEEQKTAASEAADNLKKLNNTPDITDQFDAADISDNKVMGVLCYLGWLVIIPLVASKSRYVKFHANQGLVLAIASIICSILAAVPIIGWIISFVGGIFTFVLMILGIINVVNGKAKQLPIIGKISLIKY